ncbi:hypothetical protein Lal_00034859 [Lupinus albus]|nr:hypothetical protein Lal_00034859 [Lupinus albus]
MAKMWNRTFSLTLRVKIAFDEHEINGVIWDCNGAKSPHTIVTVLLTAPADHENYSVPRLISYRAAAVAHHTTILCSLNGLLQQAIAKRLFTSFKFGLDNVGVSSSSLLAIPAAYSCLFIFNNARLTVCCCIFMYFNLQQHTINCVLLNVEYTSCSIFNNA